MAPGLIFATKKKSFYDIVCIFFCAGFILETFFNLYCCTYAKIFKYIEEGVNIIWFIKYVYL